MDWMYSIKNKVMASVALLSLCVLVLVSNYIDRNHTENVKNAISTLYEDRLIAEGYILKMTTYLYQIKSVVNSESSTINKNKSINKLLFDIKETSNAYHQTKFTELEKTKAEKLLITLQELDPIHLKNNQLELQTADQALVLLSELAAIQLAESKQIMHHAEKLYLTGKTSSQFVFTLIVIILIVLQALVFTSKTLIPKVKANNPNFN